MNAHDVIWRIKLFLLVNAYYVQLSILNNSIGVNLIVSSFSLYLTAKYESATKPIVAPQIAKSNFVYNATKHIKLRTNGVKLI